MHTAAVKGNHTSLQSDARSSSCVTSMELCNTSRSVLRYDSFVLQTEAKLGGGFATAPGRQSRTDGNLNCKINSLNENFDFLRSKIFFLNYCVEYEEIQNLILILFKVQNFS